jgi:hypothetical protein
MRPDLRRLAIDLIRHFPKFHASLIEEFSTDDGFAFAMDMVKAFGFSVDEFPALLMIKNSAHWAVDLAFTPIDNKKHIPLQVLEDLVADE